LNFVTLQIIAASKTSTVWFHFPAHTAKLAQDWIATNCSEFIGKGECPPNSPDVIPLNCHIWEVMLGRYKIVIPSQRTLMD